ncbi:helix-turn-helix domain-containing protein [Aureibacter tunicatorum]|uniref:AraC-like DNA-binding protein n=1 Tax=Aureibacter tunicatorum TaxID=866807 RepID=A0AAE4BRX3_9BACT|nr:AraC family transcriptional regulator [Aureibacter tunicatorum]MDR6240624.1 AraC-like DNA-binding protein [Aureibacter tunicatorum]BDD06515.1 hypothetical protein AUTU_39980 [Aureibacter tunicatorum]
MKFLEINYKGGESVYLMKSLYDQVGGELSEHSFKYKHQNEFIKLDSYQLNSGFEIILADYCYPSDIKSLRTPDDNPDLFIINLFKAGEAVLNFDNQEQHLKANSTKGVLIYNGLFPMRTFIPANTHVQTLGFFVKKSAFKQLMREDHSILQKLFPTQEGMGYCTFFPKELNNLIDEIFKLKIQSSGATPLIMAKSLEIFALLFQSIIKMLDKDDLNGLPIIDYQRVLKIESVLLKNLDQKISLNELADEFCISISKLKRDFKALFNQSVYQYHLHAKMDEAYRKLKTGKYSILDISIEAGYESQSKFSKMFKKIKGINPKEVLQK